MVKRKTTAWLSGIAALLFITAGLRDIFAPGFLSMSMNPQPKSVLSITFSFIAGVIFLAVAISQMGKGKVKGEKPRT
jgi:uncharacterized membrane protein